MLQTQLGRDEVQRVAEQFVSPMKRCRASIAVMRHGRRKQIAADAETTEGDFSIPELQISRQPPGRASTKGRTGSGPEGSAREIHGRTQVSQAPLLEPKASCHAGSSA